MTAVQRLEAARQLHELSHLVSPTYPLFFHLSLNTVPFSKSHQQAEVCGSDGEWHCGGADPGLCFLVKM